MGVAMWAPSMLGDERFTEWMAKHTRQSVSRGAVLPLMKSFEAYDLVDVFPAVRVPALVLHRGDDRLVPVSHGRWIADHIPDARYVELPGVDHLPFIGDVEDVLSEVGSFLVGSDHPPSGHRRLLTLLSTDLDEPAGRVEGLGDDAWRELFAAQDETVRTHLARFMGTEVNHVGHGVLAAFDGPARAIRCAMGILEATSRLRLAARVGVHTGECEVVDNDVRGIAVHVAAGIVEQARPGELLVSGTVRDLVAGSGIRFGEPRQVELRGLTGARVVFPVLTHGATPEAVRRLAIESASVLRCEGEYWTIAYDGQVATIRDTKGLRDARLLAVPQQELHTSTWPPNANRRVASRRACVPTTGSKLSDAATSRSSTTTPRPPTGAGSPSSTRRSMTPTPAATAKGLPTPGLSETPSSTSSPAPTASAEQSEGRRTTSSAPARRSPDVSATPSVGSSACIPPSAGTCTPPCTPGCSAATDRSETLPGSSSGPDRTSSRPWTGFLMHRVSGRLVQHSGPITPRPAARSVSVERFHQTLKKHLAKQDRSETKKQPQVQLDAFVDYYNDVRPHRAVGRRPPAEAFAARERAYPSGPRIDCTGYRVRHDRIEKKGSVTLRHKGRLHHIGVGAAYKGWRVVLLLAGLEVRILSLDGTQLGG